MTRTVKVLAINRGAGLVLIENDIVLEIDSYYDAEGDEVDDPDLAIACVAGAGDFWITLDLREFPRDDVTVH